MGDVNKVGRKEISGAAVVDGYVFQQDGASVCAANVAPHFCVETSPGFISKQDWPPKSPDPQRRVDHKNPGNLVALAAAIRRAVSGLPLETAQQAVDGF